MAKVINDEISEAIKCLVKRISGFEENTDTFKAMEKFARMEIKKSDTMYFLNKKYIDEDIKNMADKFRFHGFNLQADQLLKVCNKYISNDLSKSELMTRLNIVKFLLCMSECPTKKFLSHPEEFGDIFLEDDKDDINWKQYLNEGIEIWKPNMDESSTSEDLSFEDATDDEITLKAPLAQPILMENLNSDEILDLCANREELLATVQHSWFNDGKTNWKPESTWEPANVGILWETYLLNQVRGLISLPPTSIISEYKVIREILWQMWHPHNSTVFQFKGNALLPRENVTISSSRAQLFDYFLRSFIPYMEHLRFFREFSDFCSESNVPHTYKSYNKSLNDIIQPIYDKLCDLEENVRKQEETLTLLKIANELEIIFEPVLVLRKIHSEIIIDSNRYSSLECASNLLSKLHNSLQYSVDKLEQNLRFSLFIGSLYHYFKIIDSWLMKNDFIDYTGEFIIVKRSKDSDSNTESDIWKMNFEVNSNLSDFAKNNSFLRIIIDKVLQIGRNMHLLRLLGKYMITDERTETIHEEFVRKILENLSKYYNIEFGNSSFNNFSNADNADYIYPVLSIDDCKKPTDMDNIENLVDISDGLLMKVFGDYFIKQNSNDEKIEPSTFENVEKRTTNFLPVKNFFESIFLDILKDRFTISGLKVKSMLVEEYKLDRQFVFLRHAFLFFDDLIFSFYRRFFEQINSQNRNWGNEIWLTSHLQDILMDFHPDFSENCTVQVKEHWRTCCNSLDACTVVNLHFNIQWPLNIIITPTQMLMYRELFQFILKIKWALYTLNHLNFNDIETKKQKLKSKSIASVNMKLKYLKFHLINIINNIQHYVFGFVFSKSLVKFELDFEKSNDLRSITNAHEEFIKSIHSMVITVRDTEYDKCGFNMLLHCIKKLESLWGDRKASVPEKLDLCYNIFKTSYAVINSLINPVYIFDY